MNNVAGRGADGSTSRLNGSPAGSPRSPAGTVFLGSTGIQGSTGESWATRDHAGRRCRRVHRAGRRGRASAIRRSANRLHRRPGSRDPTRSPRRSPRTRGHRAPSASSWSASAVTRPGVFSGYPPALADSKVGSRLVHGRSAAGGWSQHRFARRREKQANEALDAAADVAVAVFRPRRPTAGRGRPRRGQADGRRAARRPEARPVPGHRDRAVPHRARPEASRPRGHAEAVHRGANKAYRAFIGVAGVGPRTITAPSA